MKSITSILLVSLLFIGCKKSELVVSQKIENDLAKSAYYPTKDIANEYNVSTFINDTIQEIAKDNLLAVLKVNLHDRVLVFQLGSMFWDDQHLPKENLMSLNPIRSNHH